MRYHEGVLLDEVITATGQSDDVTTAQGELGAGRSGNTRMFINVSAGGGGILTMTIEGKLNGVYYPLVSFATFVGAGKETEVIPECPDIIRASWVVAGGSPSFTTEITCSRY